MEAPPQLQASEFLITRLSQLFVALSQCNKAMVHSKSEEELLPQICRAVVQYGGMKMAWVGRVDKATDRVRPVASYGSGTEYLDEIQILTDGKNPLGKGPVGTSIRKNTPIWIQDFLNDPNAKPWHERGAHYGWLAAAALPLLTKGQPIGALVLYADTIHAFDDETRKLLIEMASDISFALDNFIRNAEHREAVEELYQNRNMLAHILNSMPQGVFWKDRNSVYLGCNEVFAQNVGLSKPEDIIGKTDFDLPCPKDGAEGCISDDKAVMEGNRSKYHILEPIHQVDGTPRWLDTAKMPLTDSAGRVYGVLGVYEDITARKQAEEKLRESMEKYRVLTENMKDVVWTLDTQTQRFLYVSPSIEKLRGYTPDEVMSKPMGAAFMPEDMAAAEDRMRQRASDLLSGKASPNRFYTNEVKQPRKDGSIVWTEVVSNYYLNEKTGHVEVNGVTRNITERRQAEEKLRESQLLTEEILNTIPVKVFWKDKNLRFLGCNAEFAHDAGFSDSKDIIGKDDSQMRWRDQARAFCDSDSQVIESGCPQFLSEESQTTPDGNTVTLLASKIPLRNSKGEICGVLGMYMDITKHKQMEEKLMKGQRMESIGRLAAGVAHDLNNILTPIILSADILRSTTEPDERESLISSIAECAQRGANVVEQVLTFARGAKGERMPLNLNRLVQDMEKIMHETFPKNITINNTIASDFWAIVGDPTQIHQVLLNLCINARDAMPDGGALLISGENQDIDEAFAAMVPDAMAGDYAVLSISDSGTGMSRNIIDKIFDPFFTTKEVGKGTGLGLSTAIGIVRSHGGFVTVESEVGNGSTFKIFLPAEKTGATESRHSANKEMPQGRGETILVVEDEAFVVEVTSMLLKKNGYKVLTAADGIDALARYREHSNAIKIVITDVMMPRMDGVQLSGALKEINPQVNIIASTGHATEGQHAELKALGVHVILSKPYDAGKLLTTLHDAINEDAES